MNTFRPQNVDEYIATFPEDVQCVLEQIRVAIIEAAPTARETISYAMPAFTLSKRQLVYFAAFKHHIGFYALPSGNEAFQREISDYKTGKGSIQFPLDKPMPIDLIKKIVTYRVKENMDKAAKTK